jgi:hypothetical protein
MTKSAFRAALKRLSGELVKVHSVKVKFAASTPVDERKRLHARQVGREPLLRKAIDDACRFWVANNRWPLMENANAALIWERLYQANLFGSCIFVKGFSNRKMTPDELLLLLLIQVWEGWGVYRFRQQQIERPARP